MTPQRGANIVEVRIKLAQMLGVNSGVEAARFKAARDVVAAVHKTEGRLIAAETARRKRLKETEDPKLRLKRVGASFPCSVPKDHMWCGYGPSPRMLEVSICAITDWASERGN